MISIRKLEEDDFDNGYLETLSSLRPVNLSVEEAKNVFNYELDLSVNHVIYVADIESRIVGTATIIIEKKLIHRGGKVGHIEDVAVHEDYRKLDIGKNLVETVLKYAENQGCYKTILNCSYGVEKFYLKLNFNHHEMCMRFDH